MQPLHRSIEVLDWIPIRPSGVIPWFNRSTLYATRILLNSLACFHSSINHINLVLLSLAFSGGLSKRALYICTLCFTSTQKLQTLG